MEQYDDLRVAGRGAYSVVRLVRRKRDGMLLCMKRFHTPLSELSPRERAEVAQEIKLLAHLRHPNIIRFEDNFIDDTGSMNIVMEYAAGGTLSLSLANRMGQYLPEDRIWEGFVQLLSALRYVHSCNVLHRDLKTQNILLAGPQFRTLKLGDFGKYWSCAITQQQAAEATWLVVHQHSGRASASVCGCCCPHC